MEHHITPELIEELRKSISLTDTAHVAMTINAPYTGEALFELPLGNDDDVRFAMERARRAQREWAVLSLEERTRVFKRYHDLLLSRQDELLDMIQLENGKARKDAFEEIADTAMVSRHYAYHAKRCLDPRRRKGGFPLVTEAWQIQHPLGIVGIISPWNYPLSMSIPDAIPALIAGNAVVLNPAKLTSLTALLAVKLLGEAGLPHDLFQVVTGHGSEVGRAIIEQANFVGFTGSTRTGKTIGKMAAERLVDFSLELGGKNPMIIFADANLNHALKAVVHGCFVSSGHLCVAIERLYLHSSIYERFARKMVKRTTAMKLAATFDYSADMGSLISQDQLEKVMAHVADAVKKGAKVLCGGKARPDIGPCFFEPTILENVTEEMSLHREETFGPVVSVYPFESADEAVEKANDTEYGLNAAVWTRDKKFGRSIAERILAGSVNVNDSYRATWASTDVPMGGFKNSGIGRRHGDFGILKYTESQAVAIQHLHPILPPKGMSERTFTRLLTRGLQLIRRIPGLR